MKTKTITLMIGLACMILLAGMVMGVTGGETSNQKIETGELCSGVIYNEECYGVGKSFIAQEKTWIDTSKYNIAIDEIEFSKCYMDEKTGETICPTLIPSVKLLISEKCVSSEEMACLAVYGPEEVILYEGDYFKFGDNLAIELKGVAENSEAKTATFKIIKIGETSTCPVGCKCTGNVATCPTEFPLPGPGPTETVEGETITITEMGKKKIVNFGGLRAEDCIVYKKDCGAGDEDSCKKLKANCFSKFKVETTDEFEVKGNKIYLNDKEVKIMPETASEKALEVLEAKQGVVIYLKDVGKPVYEFESVKEAKLFALFNTKMTVKIQIDAETGDFVAMKKPWWSFLASE